MKKELEKLINESKSFSSEDEKDYFLELLGVMNNGQKQRLKDILDNEQKAYKILEKKFGKDNNLSKKEFYNLYFN